MAVTFNGSDNYGFLTGRGFDNSNNASNVFRSENSNRGSILTKSKMGKQQNDCECTRDGVMKSIRPKKRNSWWKSVFRSKKDKCKPKQDKSVVKVLRHKSDPGITLQPSAKSPEHKHILFQACSVPDESVVIVDDVSLREPNTPTKASKVYVSQLKKASSLKDVSPLQRTKSASIDCLESVRKNCNHTLTPLNMSLRPPEFARPFAPFKHDPVLTLSSGPINKVLEEKKPDELRVDIAASKTKTKPQKPIRKRHKPSTVNANSTDDVVQRKQNNSREVESISPSKTHLRRSRSMLSFKSLFSRKSRPNSMLEKSLANRTELLNDTKKDELNKNAIQSTKCGDYEINVYDRYPRRKSEQRKVLVHIHTREEIPVENGVPQWDSASYQYTNPETSGINEIKLKQKRNSKFVESSFVGKVATTGSLVKVQGTPEDCQNNAENKSSSIHIVNFDSEPKKRDIHHETENIEQQTTAHVPRPKLHEKSPSFSESLLFGRSFVITGCATDKVPDVIARNYPYISDSSAVRNMAQCLRLAKQTGLTKKLSPDRTICYITDNKAETSSKDNPSNLQPHYDHHASENSTTSLVKVTSQATDTLSGATESPFQPRRCFSDSDLSSIHMSPMKLDEARIHKDGNTSQGKKTSRTRSARNDRLLHRMRTRMERLERLSDLAFHHDERINVVASNSSNARPFQINKNSSKIANCSVPQKTLTKEQIDESVIKTNPTSSRKFNRLIKAKMQHRDAVKATDRVASLQHMQKDLTNSLPDPEYDHVWPDGIDEKSSQDNTVIPKHNHETTITELVFNPSNNPNKQQAQMQPESTITTHVDIETNTVNICTDQETTCKDECRTNTELERKEGKKELDFGREKQIKITTVKNCIPLQTSPEQVKLGKQENLYWSLESPLDSERLSPINHTFNTSDFSKDESMSSKGHEQPSVSSLDIFLSSTPVKNYSKHAESANRKVLLPSTAPNDIMTKEIPVSDNVKEGNVPLNGNGIFLDTTTVSAANTEMVEQDDLSTSPSIFPSASDYFLKSLLQQQDEIKRTMLQEMRKITNKYSAQPNLQENRQSIPGRNVFGSDDDRKSPESDSTSQGTVKWDSDACSLSSGDTITNLIGMERERCATTSSNDSTAAQFGSMACCDNSLGEETMEEVDNSFRGSANRQFAVEYVIPFQGEKPTEVVRDFMKWDCDETDL